MNISLDKSILQTLISKIPPETYGSERVSIILEEIGRLPSRDRQVLRDFFNKCLAYMIEKNASDIEFGGNGNIGFVWMRIFGKLYRIRELPVISEDEACIIIANLLNEKQRLFLDKNRCLDFSHTFFIELKKTIYRFRCNAFYDMDTLALNMRAIDATTRPLTSLGFGANINKILTHGIVKQGLVLITGITGSGKSSTLDSIIHEYNQTEPVHIIVVAHPIEYVHKSFMSLIKYREVGKDVLSFKDGIVQALRQDPDVIVIGEMRDPATISAALEITDTGHKVYSTLHTSSAVESIDRILAECEVNEQERVRNRLADVLVAIISQKLVRGIDGTLIMVKEVLVVTPSVKAAIKNNNTSEIYMMINQGGALGMITMEQDLKRLYMAKKISLETAIAHSNNKTRIQQILTA